MNVLRARRIPIDDDYATCERTVAKLLIYPGKLNPDEISRTLEITPSETRTKGRQYTNSLGRTWSCPLNAWFLSSEGMVSSKDLRRHLNWLLDQVEPKGLQLLELQNEPGLGMTVNCVWWSVGGQGGPTLWPEQMERLAKLNLECAFDISFFGSDDEPDPRARTTIS